MPRASSTRSLPLLPILILAGLVVVGVAALLILRSGLGSRNQTDHEVLPAADFARNSTGYRGNTYQVEGEVTERVRWTTAGEILWLTTTDGDQPLPVMIPATLRQRNIDRGRRYRFVVEIDQQGIPVAQQITDP